MARFLLCCLILINAHFILANAYANGEGQVIARASRKLGSHNIDNEIAPSSPSPSPSGVHEVDESRSAAAAAPEQVINLHHRYHHTIDKSVAGGGVILGALATGFLVAVFCYIRATRKKGVEPGSPIPEEH